MSARLRTVLGQFLGWLRDGWLIVGVTLFLFIMLDVVGGAAVRAYDHLVHGRGDQSASRLHPNAGEPWFLAWEAHGGARDLVGRFDPYRGWTMEPVSLSGLHIDSAGHRVTIEPPPAADPRPVFMLGGSVMWGFTVRDSATLPSLVAARVRAAGLNDIVVVNDAQPAYNLTQEVVTLMLELRSGHVPRAVVFLDGVNDVATLAEYREPGHSMKDAELARRVDAGQGAWARVLSDAAQSSTFIRLLQARLVRWQTEQKPMDPTALCARLAAQYQNLTGIVDHLGKEYGFTPIFFWQPTLATTRKSLTPWEHSIAQTHPYRQLYAPCTAAVDSSMARGNGPEFLRLDGIYDGDTSSVFLDEWGHVTETANGKMADRIASALIPVLGPRS